jgi:hypothetical protein
MKQTLLLLKQNNNTLLVQIYVDGIFFGESYHKPVAKFTDILSKHDGRTDMFWVTK